ncbi:MAG: DUF1592 domain-containing protein [Deltaproteobacteria bacterium]|nr:DUF1592 domain-containing protein [Nannocystaceae bacterium]
MLRRILRSPSGPIRLGPSALLAFAALLSACRGDESRSDDNGDGTDGTDTASDGPTSSPTDGTSADESGEAGDDGGIEIEPAPGGLRRLTSREYTATVEMLLGADAAAAAVPPVDVPQDGFDAVGGNILSLDGTAIEQYETSARAIAAAAVANPAKLAEIAPCVTQSPDAACYEEVAIELGKLAFRRPLEQAEIDTFVAVAEHGQEWGEGDFGAGLTYELAAILQCPSFIYLVELGEPDEDSGFRRLNPYELATRMSIFLLGRGPDAALLTEAEAGGLADGDMIRAKAQEMLGTARARAALSGFFDEYFRLRSLSTEAKNPELFPKWDAALASAMRQETQLLVHDVVWENDADYREIFTADYTYVNDDLADLYGIAPPGQGNTYVRTPWPDNQLRAGYLSQASFLTHQSGPLRNSPTKRGRFVQQWVLCTDVPPPPVGVDPTLPDLGPDATLREILLVHLDNESCATCHGIMDPVGFAFEFYDAIGAYRTVESNGQPLEAQGEIEGYGEWNNAKELAQVVADDPRTSKCFVTNLIRGSLGHKEVDGEADAITALDQSFADSEYSVQALLTEFPASPLFRLVDEPK